MRGLPQLKHLEIPSTTFVLHRWGVFPDVYKSREQSISVVFFFFRYYSVVIKKTKTFLEFSWCCCTSRTNSEMMGYLTYTDARFLIRRYGCWLSDASCAITHNDVTHYKLQPQTVVFVKDNRAITVALFSLSRRVSVDTAHDYGDGVLQ